MTSCHAVTQAGYHTSSVRFGKKADISREFAALFFRLVPEGAAWGFADATFFLLTTAALELEGMSRPSDAHRADG